VANRSIRDATGHSVYQCIVVDRVMVVAVPGTPGDTSSDPTVSFSINTPCFVGTRFVVVVTTSRSDGGTGGMTAVVVVEVVDCAKLAPDTNVRTVAAASRSLDMMDAPWRLWRTGKLAGPSTERRPDG
jgi:hypothetical protein